LTTSDPTGIHDWSSESYVRDWIAAQRDDRMAEQLRRAVHLIPFDPDRPIRVLDVGGGYGAVTRAVLEVFPSARVTLQDISEPMIAEAKQRLADFGNAVTYSRSDLTDPNWTAALEGQFDAVVSARAIHNVRFPDRIRAIYAEIAAKVAPGGCFVNLDQAAAAGPLVEAATRQAQRMARRRRLFEQTGAWHPLNSPELGSRRDARDDHDEASAEDRARIEMQEPATLANQLRWLVEAGFAEADCAYRDGGRVLLIAYKASA
jgi:tRNA (cmo5U34)-methyltransferase